MTASGANSRSAPGGALRRLLVEDAGQDIIEYGLLISIVMAVGFLVFIAIHAKMGPVYSTWGTAILDNWVPSAPAGP